MVITQSWMFAWCSIIIINDYRPFVCPVVRTHWSEEFAFLSTFYEHVNNLSVRHMKVVSSLEAQKM